MNAPTNKEDILLLRGGWICDGAAAPRPATVVIEKGKIKSIAPPGESSGELPSDARTLDLSGHLITPGLMDCHTHLFDNKGDPNDHDAYERTLLKESLPLRALYGAANAKRLLHEGFTTVRDVCTEGAGYADVALAEAVKQGWCEGPAVIPCGPGMGITGGYLPMGYAPGVNGPMGCSIVDGADAARREVRVQVSHGVAWIKAFADWPVMDRQRGGGKIRPTFTAEELTALVDEAARHGRRVAAHADSDAGVMQAIACGAASIEHLGDLSRETLDAVAAKGVFIVPTLSVHEQMVKMQTDPKRREKLQRRFEDRLAALGRALAAGVRIALGTDIGAYPHAQGSFPELRLLMAGGMTPLQALAAATREPAALLQLPEKGVLTPEATADLCAFKFSGEVPELQTVLTADPPVLVIQGGRVVKSAIISSAPRPDGFSR